VPGPTGAVLGIDIGGTKLAAGIVEPDGSVLVHRQTATPPDATAEELFGVVVALANDVVEISGLEPVACGVGCGGPMDATTVSPLNIPAWRGFPLAGGLREALGLPVAVDNDAKSLALGEWRFGAARTSRNFLAMVVSTGIGGGVVLDGRLLDGRLGNAGHIGHVNVEPDGRVCACGARGCLEAEASGTAIQAITGLHPKDASVATMERCGTHVGRAVASVANLLDLDLAVIGGSVALGFGAPFYAAARDELASRARLEFSKECRIEPVGLGDIAPLVGAGAVAMRLVEAQRRAS
jgi:glucokinase